MYTGPLTPLDRLLDALYERVICDGAVTFSARMPDGDETIGDLVRVCHAESHATDGQTPATIARRLAGD